jgi:hypothetical protein
MTSGDPFLGPLKLRWSLDFGCGDSKSWGRSCVPGGRLLRGMWKFLSVTRHRRLRMVVAVGDTKKNTTLRTWQQKERIIVSKTWWAPNPSKGMLSVGNRRQWPLIVHLWTLQMVFVKSNVCEFWGGHFLVQVARLIVTGTTSILLFCWGRFSTYPFDPMSKWCRFTKLQHHEAWFEFLPPMWPPGGVRWCFGVQPPAIKPGNGSALFLVGKQRKLT